MNGKWVLLGLLLKKSGVKLELGRVGLGQFKYFRTQYMTHDQDRGLSPRS